jgi:hypothetical protein
MYPLYVLCVSSICFYGLGNELCKKICMSHLRVTNTMYKNLKQIMYLIWILVI